MSLELIQKFPDEPVANIIYYVYNDDMVEAAEELIVSVKGQEYFDEHVTVCSIGRFNPSHTKCLAYYDPCVFKYKNSWNN